MSLGNAALAPNVVAALFAVLMGAVFLMFAAVHLRPRPTLVRGRNIALGCVLAILFPLFIEPIHELLRGALVGEAYPSTSLRVVSVSNQVWASVLRLALFVVVTVGVAWYFRGWLLFNIDTKVLDDLIRDSCRAIDLPCQATGPEGEARRFSLGQEGRELRLRREPGSRFASLALGSHKGLPWITDLTRELRRRTAGLRTGRYYSRAAIYLLIGLVCLGFAVILFAPERLGFVAPSFPSPTTF